VEARIAQIPKLLVRDGNSDDLASLGSPNWAGGRGRLRPGRLRGHPRRVRRGHRGSLPGGDLELDERAESPCDPATWPPLAELDSLAGESFTAAGTSPALAGACDELIGPGRWASPVSPGGAVVVRFPSEDRVNAGYHIEGRTSSNSSARPAAARLPPGSSTARDCPPASLSGPGLGAGREPIAGAYATVTPGQPRTVLDTPCSL
jgi:hypothetical protein